MELTAQAVADAGGGAVITGSPAAVARGFAIDSRVLEPGNGFVALRAARDGHDFVGDAFARGATLAIVERRVPNLGSDDLEPEATLVQVADSSVALGALARVARSRLAAATVVAVTGSAGKTSTKDLIAAAMRPARRVHASPGSYNNEAGLPLTLLGATVGTEVVVAEMGARFTGNIAELAELARPDVGVVTNVGLAHAEHLGGRAGIAQVKGELLEALPSSGLAVLNDDCDASTELARRTDARVLRVGRTARADVEIQEVALDEELRPSFGLRTPWGEVQVRLELRGAHQAENAAMAVAVAAATGVDLTVAATGVATATAAAHRMELVHIGDRVTVLNDAYNSSPTAAAAALRALVGLPVAPPGAEPGGARRIAVLGEMRELGPDAEREHEALGALAAELGVDVVVAVGEPAPWLARGAQSRAPRAEVWSVADAAEAATVIVERVRPGDAVLVKASRTIGLERVVAALEASATGSDTPDVDVTGERVAR